MNYINVIKCDICFGFYQINILADIKNMFVCFLNRGTLQFASSYNLKITINTFPF